MPRGRRTIGTCIASFEASTACCLRWLSAASNDHVNYAPLISSRLPKVHFKEQTVFCWTTTVYLVKRRRKKSSEYLSVLLASEETFSYSYMYTHQNSLWTINMNSRRMSEVWILLSMRFFNPWTPRSDQYINSPYNFNTLSSRQVMRI